MVGAPTQALVAQQLGMDNYIISRQQLTQEKMGWKQKILADLMEAFIAALFIGKTNRHSSLYIFLIPDLTYIRVIDTDLLIFRPWDCSC